MADSVPGVSKADKDLIEEMVERFRMTAEAESASRDLMIDDLKFEAGFDEHGKSTQWNPVDLQQWTDDGRPALTLNQIRQFTDQVTNDFRQIMPAIHVIPEDGNADPTTSDALEDIVRAIHQNSHARVAYETGYEPAVKCGFGAWRVLTKHSYDAPKNKQEFNAQHIEIKRIKDPLRVYGDPSGEEPDGSDWDYCHLSSYLLDSEYRRQFPRSKLANLSDWSDIAKELPPDWMGDKAARVVEYFYSKHKTEKYILFSDGTVVSKSTLDSNVKEFGSAGITTGVDQVDEREVDARTIHWLKSNGVEVLDKTDWPGIYIPVVPIYGSEYTAAGKTIRYGMVRNAKDPQRALNYMASSEVEAIGLMPKSPLIVAAGQVDKYKEIWGQANKKSFAYLPYDPVEIGGKPVERPHRESFEPAIMAISAAKTQFQNDLKASTGMYGSNLGEPAGEKSGLAIQSRQSQGDKATFHFQSNAERSLWHTGRIILDLIPSVYEDQSVLPAVGKDNKHYSVVLDRTITPDQKIVMAKQGRFNITHGRYGVTIVVAPSYPTQRQEIFTKLSEILKTWPNLFPIVGHILMRNIDIPGGAEMADEIEKAMAQQKAGPSPQVQQQIQVMQQQLQSLAQQLQDARNREMARSDEIQSRETIARWKNETELAVAEITAKHQDAQQRREMENEQWKLLHGFAADAASQAADQAHEANLQGAQQAHEAGMAAQEQATAPPPAPPNGAAPPSQ